MKELNINKNKIYSTIKGNSKFNDYKNEIIQYSILRNNLNNQIINEFSITVGDKQYKNFENKTENKNVTKRMINKNKKYLVKKEEKNSNKKTIINVNQFYPSYFINAQEQSIKEKK